MISNQQAASNPRSTAVCSVGGGTQLEEGEALFGVMRAGATAPVMGLSSGFRVHGFSEMDEFAVKVP